MSGFDYRSNHPYFVTIVTGKRLCVFGEIEEEVLKPTRRGLVATECWNDVPKHHPFVELDAFVLMPNHIHGILLFVGNADQPVAATPASPPGAHGPASRSLGAVIGSFKSAVSRTINKLRPGAAQDLWQPNYYEHIIRHDHALERIREYILTNPQRWRHDNENPDGLGGDDYKAFIASVDLPKEGDAGVAATGRKP